MLTHSQVSDLDAAHIWHPYASPYPTRRLPVVRDGYGARLVLETDDGTHEVVDGMASWWCAVHGYRNPRLDAAAHAQIDRLSHVMFGGLTHEPAAVLTEKLLALAPDTLDRVFLADSGSVAMEIAIKIARQIGFARGRTCVATIRGGYHGDTWGDMSVCDPEGGMHNLYLGQLSHQVFLPRPPSTGAADDVLAAWRDETTQIIHDARDEVSAIVCEPLLQGAGGMWHYDVACLRHLRDLSDRYELLLIGDEIATGFGRTGTLWACEQADVAYDVMAVGKALTGGYCTQAAVLTTPAVARALADSPGGALMHGPTFMANPLASAVAAVSLDLIAEGSWREDVPRIARAMEAALAPLRGTDGVADVRVFGATATVEMRDPVDMALATQTAIDHGIWLRPFGRLVYAMPIYVSTDADLEQLGAGMRAVVKTLLEHA